MPQPIYRIENLTHRYNRKTVLSVDRLDIQPASIVGLAGPNGSGKSTLLKLMAFILRPTTGRILFDGRTALPFDDAVRFQVTLLTQEPYLMKRTVTNNIAYGLNVRGDDTDRRARIHTALGQVGLDPELFAGRQWNELSGGEAQRVALAARLVLKPRVLLLDEPTASVDAASSELIRSASLNARETWGTTLVIASHDREWLNEVCDEVIHLFKGRPSGTGRSNMIFGPWQVDDDGRHFKPLGDDQHLIVPTPPAADATAFIDPAAFRVVLQKAAVDHASGRSALRGTITRLSLERHSGTLFADVRIGAQTLVVCIDDSRLAAMTLQRGWPVTLTYRPDRVQWR